MTPEREIRRVCRRKSRKDIGEFRSSGVQPPSSYEQDSGAPKEFTGLKV
jgi:hypothetical protein